MCSRGVSLKDTHFWLSRSAPRSFVAAGPKALRASITRCLRMLLRFLPGKRPSVPLRVRCTRKVDRSVLRANSSVTSTAGMLLRVEERAPARAGRCALPLRHYKRPGPLVLAQGRTGRRTLAGTLFAGLLVSADSSRPIAMRGALLTARRVEQDQGQAGEGELLGVFVHHVQVAGVAAGREPRQRHAELHGNSMRARGGRGGHGGWSAISQRNPPASCLPHGGSHALAGFLAAPGQNAADSRTRACAALAAGRF